MNTKQLNSQNQSVIFSEDCPVVQSGAESSSFNRFKKYIRTIGQHEWISQLDLFRVPLKLTFNGQDSYKTQFGGLITLIISIICIFFAIVVQLPNGINLNTQVEILNFQKSLKDGVNLFDYGDKVFQIYFYNTTSKKIVTDSSSFIQDIKLYNVVMGQNRQIQLSKDCQIGSYCLKKSKLNENIQIFKDNGKSAYVRLQIMSCGRSNSTCQTASRPIKFFMAVTNYDYKTNKITPKVQYLQFSRQASRKINLQKVQYTTNNMFFGFIANIFAKTLQYYYFEPFAVTISFTQSFPVIGSNFKANCSAGRSCSYVNFDYSGTTIEATQVFLDLTAPILLFLSLYETLTFLVWILFLRNYSNNCLHLKLASTLVYIPKEGQSHHNFKNGGWTIFTCFVYHHPLTQLLNKVLFRFCQTNFIRMLPLQVQLTAHMIDFGEQCLGQKYFFGNLNSIYDLENIRPTKIIPNLKPKEQPDEPQSEEDESESKKYFDNEIQEQAFKRLCNDHQHFSSSRKQYISVLLKQKSKNYKLVLIVQQMFKRYKLLIEKQRSSRLVQIPINPIDDEHSGNELRLPK